MPLKRLLDESGSFDPKAVAIMLEAYDGVVAELGLQATDEREKAARLVMQLARSRVDLDTASLRSGVTDLIRNEGRSGL
jgi:hypothetical protein